MGIYSDEKKEKQTQLKANRVQNKYAQSLSSLYQDYRPEAAEEERLIDLANQSSRVEEADGHAFQKELPIQQKVNKTGLPDGLKASMENMSGYALDDTRVHYNSSKPAQLNAHAYAQGNDIHLASGQEKHLPHEAWHVVQQKQGRVRPTIQSKEGIAINNDTALELEADVMGAKALQASTQESFSPSLTDTQPTPLVQQKTSNTQPVQRVLNINNEAVDDAYIDDLDEVDFELAGVAWTSVVAVLKSWIALNATKNATDDANAVTQALAAINTYTDFAEDEHDFGDLELEGDDELGDEDRLVNYEAINGFTTAGFSANERIILFDLLGDENFTTFGESAAAVGTLRTIYTTHGINTIEELLAMDTNRLLGALQTITNLSARIGTMGADRMITLITARTNVQINTLFTSMLPARVETLTDAVVNALATHTAPEIAGINGQWPSWGNWLQTVASLNTIYDMVGDGYTYAQCATLVAHNLSVTEIRALQQETANYAVLNAFITEARRYGLPYADMLAIAHANNGAAIGVLTAAIRTQSLNRIDKNARFPAWIRAVSLLMVDLAYTLNIDADSLLLNGEPETHERRVRVRNAGGAQQGIFVIHYHPHAADAAVGSPDASPRHIKPQRGGAIRMYWDLIPANIRALLPNHFDD